MKINANKMENVITACNESNLDTVTACMKHLLAYHNHVYIMPQMLQSAQLRAFDIEDYHHDVERLDRQRVELHNKAIAGLEDIMRVAQEYSITDVVDMNGRNYQDVHRTEIGDAIFSFCAEWVENHK